MIRSELLVRAALLTGVAAFALTAMPGLAQSVEQTNPDAAVEPPAAEATPSADAQTATEAAAASDPEIIVTARRRNEILLDVPIAVTAYSGEQLERQGALDITDVSDTTPNVNLETSRGTNTTLTAFIRGVGQQDPVAGFEQGVGIYLDDVYLNRPQGALLDIYDVERIEILRGPQGTLYGRNTIGGAVKYVTRRLSDEPEFRARAHVGTYNQLDLVVSASTPMGASGIKAGASVARLGRDGFGKNLTTGEENYNKDIFAVRGTIEVEPADRAFVRLSGDYTYDQSNPRGGHRLIAGRVSGTPVLEDEFDSRGGLEDPEQKVKGGGVALHGEVGLNDWLTLKSITAWRKDRSETPIDFDALPAVDVDVPAIYKNKQFSQEVQAVIDRGPLAGIIGAYYLKADAQTTFDVRLYTSNALLPGLTALTAGDVGTKTWAVFGDFTYDFTEQLSASLGGRYTNDKRHAKVLRQTFILGGSPELGGSPPFGAGIPFPTPAGSITSNFDGRRTDTAFTPRASLAFKPNRDHNIYASYSRGFKGGGFDPRGQTTLAPDLNGDGVRGPDEIYEFMDFDPETVDSYELGWKGSVFNRRLNFALAIFQADYKDVQVPGSVGGTTLTGVPTFVGVTTNAGKARFRGVEVETNLRVAESFAAAGDRLNFAGTLGYLDAEYLEFITVVNRNPAGASITPIEVDLADFREVQNTPKWTMSGSFDYDTPVGDGRLNANATLSYRSKSQQFELRSPGLDQKGFALLDASIVWRSAESRYTIGLHGKNLTNKRYITAGYNFLNQNPYTGEYIGRGFLVPNGQPGLDPTLGREGVLTAYYGNPRQVFLSLGVNF